MNPRTTRLFLLAPLLAVLAGCTTSSPVDNTYQLNYSEYPHLPNAPTSVVLRTIANIIPGLRMQAIYGNYGGPGCKPGAPVDNMDEIFRRHDIAYFEGVTLEELYESDRLLVGRLQALDPEELSWAQNRYRRRAIKFFSSSMSERIGKPNDVRRGTRIPRIILPGNRLNAESQWDWHGPDPCADPTHGKEPHTHPPSAAPPAVAEAEALVRLRAGKFAGRRR